jgi:hypothetical protein
MLVNYQVATQLVASRVVLSSVELVRPENPVAVLLRYTSISQFPCGLKFLLFTII